MLKTSTLVPLPETTLNAVVEAHTAGSPTDDRVRWTELNPMEVARALLEQGIRVSRNNAPPLLKQAGFRRGTLRKELITGAIDSVERDEQFRHIDALRR